VAVSFRQEAPALGWWVMPAAAPRPAELNKEREPERSRLAIGLLLFHVKQLGFGTTWRRKRTEAAGAANQRGGSHSSGPGVSPSGEGQRSAKASEDDHGSRGFSKKIPVLGIRGCCACLSLVDSNGDGGGVCTRPTNRRIEAVCVARSIATRRRIPQSRITGGLIQEPHG
jgi:hypothetical protein